MAALLELLLAAGLGFALGWIGKSAARRIVTVDVSGAKPNERVETPTVADTSADPKVQATGTRTKTPK
jgi:hypothetical protein